MNGEGGIGQAEEDYGYLRGELVTGFDYLQPSPYFSPDVSVPLGNIYATIAAGIAGAQAASVPQMVPVPEIYPTVTVGAPTNGAEEVVPETADVGVIDPEEKPKYTVNESGYFPAPIFIPAPNVYRDAPATDWDQVYDDYVVLNAPEEKDVAIDWGDVIGTVATGLFQPGAAIGGAYRGIQGLVAQPSATAGPPAGTVATGITGGTAMVPGATCPPLGPRYAKICLATGQVMPLRRRRRRRLLTSSDLADLASLKAIVGGGAAMNSAVVKAVRR